MENKKQKINIEDLKRSQLPLGYHKIYLKDIPPISVELKIKIYNKKFKQISNLASQSEKPISKILN